MSRKPGGAPATPVLAEDDRQALLQALACFAHRALNMSRIESRPSKREMGEYIFFVDLELPQGKEPLLQALEELQPLCEHLAVFGAYPLTQLEEAEAA